MLSKGIVLSLLIFSFVSGFSQGKGSFFTNLRKDLEVPERCRLANMKQFNGEIVFFTLGTKRAHNFDITMDLERGDANQIWRLAKQYVRESAYSTPSKDTYLSKVSGDARRHLDVLISNFDRMGFDFGSEGEVLELIAIKHFLNKPESVEKVVNGDVGQGDQLRTEPIDVRFGNYYVTGSVEYHYKTGRTLGELDIVVGMKDTCQVVAIGEAKLGRRTGKARSQIARFQNFLRMNSGSNIRFDFN